MVRAAGLHQTKVEDEYTGHCKQAEETVALKEEFKNTPPDGSIAQVFMQSSFSNLWPWLVWIVSRIQVYFCIFFILYDRYISSLKQATITIKLSRIVLLLGNDNYAL